MSVIDISGVSKSYGQLQALKEIDLKIESGEFFGLLGPNGAGKTTLISILAGLTRADSGCARIMSHDVVNHYSLARRSLGVVPQELVFDPFFTVRETLRIQSGYFGLRTNDDWIDEIMFNLDLTEKANTNMRALSGGMKRRVLVAQALVHKPPVIVLDEPTAGVDVELRQGLWRFISRLNREGHTIVLTTHYLEEAQSLCGRIAMLKRGKVVALDYTRHLLERITGLQLIIRVRKGTLLPELSAYIHQKNEASNKGAASAISTGGAQLNGVQCEVRATIDNDELHWRLSDYEQIESILATCRTYGAVFDGIEIQKADLEDVFIQLMTSS